MALLKLPFRLGRPSNDTPVTMTDAVDDPNLQMSQAELNVLFNQGKNSQGEDIGGSSYAPGIGINIGADNKINVKEATGSERGGMKIAEGQSANDGTPFPVQLNNGFGIVKIPEASTTQSGLAPQSLMQMIPAQASGQNQLADKDFVNSSIATNTANYISNNGQPFASLDALEAYSGTKTNNDYAFVVGTDSAGNATYTRYKYNANNSTWAAEYVLNNSSFTAAQWAAIQSGITSGHVDKLNALPDNTGLSEWLGAKLDKSVMTTAGEAGTTATSAHAKGEYFFIGNTLYRATAAIAVNDPIVTDSAAQGYNAAATTIAGEIGAIAIALDIIVGGD